MFLLLLQLSSASTAIVRPDANAECRVPTSGTAVPAQFDGNRVFVNWRLPNNEELHLYTDTGGGMIALYAHALERIERNTGISYAPRVTAGGGRRAARIPFRDGDAQFPPIPIRDSSASMFLVEEAAPPDERPGGPRWDGLLGAFWFFDKVWTINYVEQEFRYHGSDAPGGLAETCWVELGFQRDSTGRKRNLFPRVAAEVAGETVQFLLDTGARTEITEIAARIIQDGEPRQRATSFIGEEMFDRWRTQHPDWLVVEAAEVGSGASPMIRVPLLRVGDHRVGPVWFTRRPRSSFPEFMSAYTDLPVVGALGGSLWKHGVLVLDYPRSRAAFLPR